MGEVTGVPGSNVVPFPARPRGPSDMEMVHGAAPSRSLVDTLLAEAGLPARDVASAVASDLAYQAWTFERGYGREAAILRFRAAVNMMTAHAAGVCRDFHVSADRMVEIERRAAVNGGYSVPERVALSRIQEEFRGRAIAARAAADAAIGGAAALATYIREGSGAPPASLGEPRQLTLFAMGA